MLSDEDQAIAAELRRRIAAVVPVSDFRIYGSRARGDWTAESDLDAFVKVETLTPEIRHCINEIAWEVGFDRNRIISTFVATQDQLTEGPLGANPIMKKIAEEGVAV